MGLNIFQCWPVYLFPPVFVSDALLIVLIKCFPCLSNHDLRLIHVGAFPWFDLFYLIYTVIFQAFASFFLLIVSNRRWANATFQGFIPLVCIFMVIYVLCVLQVLFGLSILERVIYLHLLLLKCPLVPYVCFTVFSIFPRHMVVLGQFLRIDIKIYSSRLMICHFVIIHAGY